MNMLSPHLIPMRSDHGTGTAAVAGRRQRRPERKASLAAGPAGPAGPGPMSPAREHADFTGKFKFVFRLQVQDELEEA
eukprot:842887-Rhodomonas_salina.2